MFFTILGCWVGMGGGGGLPRDWYTKVTCLCLGQFFTILGYWVGGGVLVHNLLMQLKNIEVFKTCLWGGGGGSQGIGTQPAYTGDLKNPKMTIHVMYVKHGCFRPYLGVFHHIGVVGFFGFFTILGCWGGGVSQGIGTQPAYAVFHPGQLKNRSFQTFFFDIVTT